MILKKLLIMTLAVVLVIGMSGMVFAEAENPTENAQEVTDEAFDNGLRDNQTALDAKAVHIGDTIEEQGFVEDNKQETPAD